MSPIETPALQIAVVDNDYIVLTNRYTGEKLQISCHAGGTAVTPHNPAKHTYLNANPTRVGLAADLGLMLRVCD